MTFPEWKPDSGSRLIHANFFFVDVVGLSDPSTSTKTQIKKIEVLNKCISETVVYSSIPQETMLMLPTGDGVCIGFLQGPELPLHLAIQLQKKLNEYNKGKIPSENIKVRIGLHNGNCFKVDDLKSRDTVWGPGIILARRVMDLGDDGHILLTSRLAEDLRELSDDYRKIIKPVHDFTIKHNQTVLVYSAYGDGFGNPNHPSKGDAQRSKYGDEIIKLQKTTVYPYLQVDLTLIDPEKMLVQHKRTYEIENISDEPIYRVLHGIATDVDKYSINDLNIYVLDEWGHELKISSINLDKPTSKEFTTEFNEPIVKGEKGRKYTLVYEVEEPNRYFENAFLIDVNKFILNFKYPSDEQFEPAIYEINQETDEKVKSKIQPKKQKMDKFTVASFVNEENVRGQTFRLEW